MNLTKVKFCVKNHKKHRKHTRFARAAAATEFGGRYWAWRQWDEFRDLTPEQLERRRADERLRAEVVFP